MTKNGARRLGMARWSLAGAAVLHMASAAALSPPAEELPYMSPRCASMLEAQRTAPNTVRYQPSFQELQRNYNEQCAENQSAARERLYREKREKKQEVALENREQQVKKLQTENEAKLKTSQCFEMRTALESRKKRTNLSEGEARDIGLFEERYKARCL